MLDRILCCLYLNVSICSRVTYKTKLFVTTVNNSFQLFPIYCHKELHLICCIGLELNIATRSTKILRGIGGGGTHTWPSVWKYERLTLPNALKIHFLRFSVLIFFHLISNGLNRININSLTLIVALL